MAFATLFGRAATAALLLGPRGRSTVALAPQRLLRYICFAMPTPRKKTDIPTPTPDMLQPGDVVTFNTHRQPRDGRSRKDIAYGGVVTAQGTVRDSKDPGKEWHLPYLRLRTVRRNGDLIARALFVEGLV